MRKTTALSSNSFLQVVIPILIMCMLLVSGCTITVINENSLSETQSELSAQSTIEAERQATLDAQLTAIADQQTAIAQPEQPDIQATQDAQSTATALSQPPDTEAPVETPTEAISFEAILITDWKMGAFGVINSGCKIPDTVCYKMNDAKNLEASLTSRDSYYIDPSWPNPYLTFWHQRELHNPAFLYFRAGQLFAIRDYSGTTDWRYETIDISEYKGKDIIIIFWADIWAYYNAWFIQEVQIIPDFTPQG